MKFAPSKWEGLDGLGEEELNRLRAPAAKAVTKAGRHFANEVKKTLSGQRSGERYPIGVKGRTYQASAPGESPAVKFGKLKQSITQTDPEWDGWNVTVWVGTNLPYARRLEWGGVSTVPRDVKAQVAPGVWRVIKAGTVIKILPRPYFEPTYLRESAAIDRILEEAVAA